MTDIPWLMASDDANRLVDKIIDVLADKRQRLSTDDNPVSLRSFAAMANLDVSVLSRAESKQRIPSLAFFLDWCSALDTSIESVVEEARSRM